MMGGEDEDHKDRKASHEVRPPARFIYLPTMRQPTVERHYGQAVKESPFREKRRARVQNIINSLPRSWCAEQRDKLQAGTS